MAISDASLDNGAGRGGLNASLGDQAKKVADDLKQSATDLGDAVSQASTQEADEIRNAATEILEDAAHRVKSAVSDQKTASADYLDTVAHAIHRAARELETDVPQAARYIRRAGSELSSVAKTVRERDLRELVSEVENVARRQPAMFFGGALMLGFVALRFLKSSPPEPVQIKDQ